MRVLVCGSRTWKDYDTVYATLALLDDPNAEIIHGAAKGADDFAGRAAQALGLAVEPHPADWERYGNSAGPIRNREMIESNIDLVLAFSDKWPVQGGTAHTCRLAFEKGTPVHIVFSSWAAVGEGEG